MISYEDHKEGILSFKPVFKFLVYWGAWKKIADCSNIPEILKD